METASLLLIAVLILATLYFANMSRKLFKAFQTVDENLNPMRNDVALKTGAVATFLSGYSITISNPKVVIFYLAILPTLLTVSDFGSLDYLIISLITPFCLLCVLGAYAYATGLATKLLVSQTFTKIVNLVAAVVFGLIALLLLYRLTSLVVAATAQI